jgi:hypothetical protein
VSECVLCVLCVWVCVACVWECVWERVCVWVCERVCVRVVWWVCESTCVSCVGMHAFTLHGEYFILIVILNAGLCKVIQKYCERSMGGFSLLFSRSNICNALRSYIGLWSLDSGSYLLKIMKYSTLFQAQIYRTVCYLQNWTWSALYVVSLSYVTVFHFLETESKSNKTLR